MIACAQSLCQWCIKSIKFVFFLCNPYGKNNYLNPFFHLYTTCVERHEWESQQNYHTWTKLENQCEQNNQIFLMQEHESRCTDANFIDRQACKRASNVTRRK